MEAETIVLVITALGVFANLAVIMLRGGRWIESVDQRLETHASALQTHASLLQGIRSDLQRLVRRLPSATVGRVSPLQLTELGAQIAESLGTRTWAKDAAVTIQEELRGMRPDQIQEFCFTFIYDKYQPDSALEEAISVAAYQNGIDTTQVLDVLAIALRDELAGRMV